MTETTQSSETAGTWRIAAAVDWRAWDGEIVAYNGRSGDTHHFADFAGWLFARLATAPTDIPSLTAAATNAVELRCGAPETTVERTLALLRKLDLLERVA
ncbi:MAG TPA: HPr-rel-A system PqqD family peptide chaperone [Stellaceae bacterium]|nr:HPr-rel-A system PqqD family peptide chaperone [Stellaceae bacterium]